MSEADLKAQLARMEGMLSSALPEIRQRLSKVEAGQSGLLGRAAVVASPLLAALALLYTVAVR